MKSRAFLPALVSVPAAALPLLLARPAAADELSAGAGDAGQITAINAGVSELSLETIFVLGYDERGKSNDFRMSLITGPTYRIFIAKNAVLGFNLSFLYKDAKGQVASSDLGGAFTAHIGYMLSISQGMFLKPLVGLGGFYAQRKVPVVIDGAEQNAATSSYGAIVRPGFDLVFYSSSRFNLFAGPEFLISLGGSDSTVVGGVKVNGEFFVSIDGGFNVGLSYVF